MLNTAELLLGLSRHLSEFAASSATAALEQLQFAGNVFEMAWRLRGSGVSTGNRVAAIGLDARIGQRRLQREVLPALETLDWVSARYDDEGLLLELTELIPATSTLVASADAVLSIAMPTPIELACLDLISATTRQPLTVDSALETVTGDHGEEPARTAIRRLTELRIVRREKADDGTVVIFNPNIWIGNEDGLINSALRAEDASVRREIGGLIEEVSKRKGYLSHW